MRTHSSTGRFAAVALAAAVVAVPLFAAAPANAAADVVTSVRFGSETVTEGFGVAQGSFNNSNTFVLPGFDACTFEYKNGTPLESNSTAPVAEAYAPYATGQQLADKGFVVGDVYTVSYADPTEVVEGPAVCVAPGLGTAGLLQASVELVSAPPAPAEIPVSAAPLSIKQGVPFSQVVALTLGEGFDFSEGGFITAGQQFGDEPVPGEISPYEGIVIESLDENTPGVIPTVRISGTAKYAGVIETGVQIGDFSSIGSAPLTITIASALGTTGPIAINAAIGAPVAGAEFTIVVGGLQPDAAWDATVRSTPIVVGSGLVNFDGSLNRTLNLPAGLEAGVHSITVNSTNADGSAFSAVLYFRVSATGTLLAVSSTPIALLANTGADLTTPAFLAGGLLLAGIALAGVTVYRRRTA